VNAPDLTQPLRLGNLTLLSRFFLAPLAGYTNLPFRLVARPLGGLGLATTDLVNARSLIEKRRQALELIETRPEDQPLAVQIFGTVKEELCAAAQLLQSIGVSVVDLNMGCPVHKVVRGGGGSAMMRETTKTVALVHALVESVKIPVTVKMRLGWDDDSRNAAELAKRAEDIGVRAVTVHGRTRKQFYTGQADWNAVGEVKAAVTIPVIVNGDIVTVQAAREALSRSGADALMLGRGVYGRPWLAAHLERALNDDRPIPEPDRKERLAIVVEHLRASVAFYGLPLGLRMFRKHLGWYIEQAPWPADPQHRRQAKARICRIEEPEAVEAAMTDLWRRDLAQNPISPVESAPQFVESAVA
jgi:nifR3 family TIM-barrel protein